MKIKFIGTGSGKTSINRFHSSILFLSNDYNLLVDCGDGISKAILSQNIHFNSINGILISHLHPDHFSGLCALIIQMKLNVRQSKLDIFIHESLIEVVKDFIYHAYIFKEKMDFVINYVPFYNDDLYTITENFKFLAKQNTHLHSYRVYDVNNKLSFSCNSFIFDLNGKNVHYTGDIGSLEDILLFKDFEKDILISEISHVSIPGLIKIAELLNIKKLILTHISDEDEPTLLDIIKTLGSIVNIEIIDAYDGLSIAL
ncbi:MAG: MBL fold metallo-hydrolase [Ignavibacteriaceae bacterium]